MDYEPINNHKPTTCIMENCNMNLEIMDNCDDILKSVTMNVIKDKIKKKLTELNDKIKDQDVITDEKLIELYELLRAIK